MSLVIVSLVIVGVGSALVVSTHALPDRTDETSRAIDAVAFAEQLEAELAYATYVMPCSATVLTLAVPDRDGDGWAEQVRYEYDAAGKRVTRSYNAGAADVVLDKVDSFALSCETDQVARAYVGPPVENPTEIKIGGRTSGGNSQSGSLSTTDWYGQVVTPAGLSGATSWRLSRARFLAMRNRSTAATINVRLMSASPPFSIGAMALETQPLSTSFLGAVVSGLGVSTWYDVDFTQNHALSPTQPISLLVTQSSGSAATADVMYDTSSPSGLLSTTNAGSTWSYSASQTMYFEAFAKAMYPGPSQSFTQRYLRRVTLALQPQGSASRSLNVGASTLNAPEILAGYWHADFAADPTTLDVNGDRIADWVEIAKVDVTKGALMGGVLRANPNSCPSGAVMVNVRFRAVDSKSEAEALRMNVGYSERTAAAITLRAAKESDATQTYSVLDGAGRVLIASTGNADALNDVRLIVDPTLQTVHLSVNGATGQTMPHARSDVGDAPDGILLGELSGKAEIDECTIRVGGA